MYIMPRTAALHGGPGTVVERSDGPAGVLQVDQSSRLGCMVGGAADVKAHAWFQGTDWDAAVAFRLLPPILCAQHDSGHCYRIPA